MNAVIRLYLTMSLDGFIAGAAQALVRRLAARDVTHLRYRIRA